MPKNISSIVQHIHNDIFLAASYFKMYRQLYDFFAEHGTRKNPIGLLTLQAYLDSIIFHLSRVLEVDNEGTNLEYLLNLAESNSKSFKYAESQNQVLSEVHGHRIMLKEIRQQCVAIRNRRDKSLAHFDRIHFNDPQKLQSQFPFTITVGEVEQLISGLWQIINVYEALYSNASGVLEPVGWRDDALIGDVRNRGREQHGEVLERIVERYEAMRDKKNR